ncbi:MAG TPA: hypothetical protein VGC42_29330, partial [Kofleriaceae bacterium]
VYDAAVSDGKVAMTVDQPAPPFGGAAGRGQAPAGEDEPHVFDRAQLTYADHGERTVTITSPVPLAPWAFTMVRDDTLSPDRAFLAPPPDEAPGEVLAIPRR